MSTTLNKNGFTLVELLLAMTLFTTVMLVATVGFIGINRTYTRGMVKKQLSESVQIITDQLTRSIRAQSDTEPTPGTQDGWSTLNFSDSCYLWKNGPNDSGLYVSPGSCGSASAGNKTGLLDERFRVDNINKLEVKPLGGGLFRISGTFTTTDIDALTDDHKSCKGTSQNVNVATCAVESFRFIVSSQGVTS